MGIWQRVSGAVGKDMDEKVRDASGVSEQRYSSVRDDENVLVRVTVANANAARLDVRSHVRPAGDSLGAAERRETGSGQLQCTLGLGIDLRGTTAQIEARVEGAVDPSALVVMSVEVFTRAAGSPEAAPNGLETYSVEGRLDDGHAARLELRLLLD